MSTTVIILSAGSGTRWAGIEAKQLVDVGGENLTERMLRQVRAHGIDPVLITRMPEIARYSSFAVSPPEPDGTCQHAYWSRDYWADRTVILLGDVIFTTSALRQILHFPGPVNVFGRPHLDHEITGHHNREIFALGIDRSGWDAAFEGFKTAIYVSANRKVIPRLWMFYWYYTGLCYGATGYDKKGVWRSIADATDDIDYEEQYLEYRKRVIDRGVLDDTPTRAKA